MSYLEIYKIEPDGTVSGYAEARNAWGGAMHIWRTLTEKYLKRDPTEEFLTGGFKDTWALFDGDTLSERDKYVLGFTFDGVWVARENCARLAAWLREFYAEHGAGQSAPTLLATADALERLAAEDCRGACFNQTSVNSNPWVVVDPDKEPDDMDRDRPFVFGRDAALHNGRVPWELFDASRHAEEAHS